MCEHSKYLGTLVHWNNCIWYVDNDDCNFKDENDETSLFCFQKNMPMQTRMQN